MEYKICTCCKVEKELQTGFHKRVNYNKSGTTYYNSLCKDCVNSRSVDWNTKNREKYNKYQRERAYRKAREAGKAIRKLESTGRGV